jgi:hypothetical protein
LAGGLISGDDSLGELAYIIKRKKLNWDKFQGIDGSYPHFVYRAMIVEYVERKFKCEDGYRYNDEKWSKIPDWYSFFVFLIDLPNDGSGTNTGIW